MRKKTVVFCLLIGSILMVSACGGKSNVAPNVTEAVAEDNSSMVNAVDATDSTVASESVAEEVIDETKEETEKEPEAATDIAGEDSEGNAVDAANKVDEQNNELSMDVLANVTKIEPAKTMYISTDVNLRNGPNTSYEIVGHGKLNQEISVIGQDKDGWYQIKNGDDITFVSNDYVSETAIDLSALNAQAVGAGLAQNATVPQTASTPQAQQATQETVAPKTVVTAPAGVLFIGDSRCVQMRDALAGGGCSWICKNGARYEWFADTAIPQADTMVGKGTKVVICMGVNDPGDAGKYAALTNLKAVEWAQRGAKVYYVSVNPVWENPYTSEEQVVNFNSTIVGSLMGVRYIDTHSYLMGTGYKLVDGLHYDGPTYFTIFNAIISSL